MRESATRRKAIAIAIVVGMTTTYVWSKVEMASTAGAVSRAQAQLEALGSERSKLVAAVALQTKPTRIQRRAEEELGMVFPTSVVGLERSGAGPGN
ncbi:MAG: hypothetical protein ABIL09_11820 [Gemmatimonadota bacterium]